MVVRAHVSAVGTPKPKEVEPALGCSRPPFPRCPSWRIDGGCPLRLRVTGGPRHDRTQAQALMEAWATEPLSCLIADRAYDVDACRA